MASSGFSGIQLNPSALAAFGRGWVKDGSDLASLASSLNGVVGGADQNWGGYAAQVFSAEGPGLANMLQALAGGLQALGTIAVQANIAYQDTDDSVMP